MKKTLHFFEEITKIPRCSGSEKAISEYLVAFAKERKLSVHQDKSLNVIIKKPGSAGREEEAPLILQGHMDMVCVSEPGLDFDFSKEAIPMYQEGDWIKAKGTTLGADNGIAVAMIMALLDDEKLSHPPLEVLVTTNEEVGLIGAGAIDGKLFKGRTLINLDSEEEGIFLSSCAGGVRDIISLPVEFKPNVKKKAFELSIHGLKGGHSGMEIDKGRANAIKLMGRLLERLGSTRLVSFEGGEKSNAIASRARAVITTNEEIRGELENSLEIFRSEYASVDPGIMIDYREVALPEEVMSQVSTEKVISLLYIIPHGVLGMSADMPGLVETSTNLGIVRTDENRVVFESAHRSSVETQKTMVLRRFRKIALLAGGRSDSKNNYPGWKFEPESPIRELFLETYRELNAVEAKVEAIHAGLECGILQEKIGKMDMIALGPDMQGAHTPEEKVSIASVDRVYSLLTKVLEKI
ncbi:MAG: aminoacyl-histidine dipeptidase [Tissierellia bacterium]|nr:aminoacyl-histidine dipeptidase [Tissierellia bacterium]